MLLVGRGPVRPNMWIPAVEHELVCRDVKTGHANVQLLDVRASVTASHLVAPPGSANRLHQADDHAQATPLGYPSLTDRDHQSRCRRWKVTFDAWPNLSSFPDWSTAVAFPDVVIIDPSRNGVKPFRERTTNSKFASRTTRGNFAK